MTDTPSANIWPKIAQAQMAIKPLEKDKHNDHSRYKYASEAMILATLNPILQEVGLVHTVSVIGEPDVQYFVCEQSQRGPVYMNTALVKVQLTLVCAETEAAWTSVSVGYAKDKNGDKAVYKAITGATKYVYMKTFGIPIMDEIDDPENDNDLINKPDPAEALRQQVQMRYNHLHLNQPLFENITGFSSILGLNELQAQSALQKLLEYEQAGRNIYATTGRDGSMAS